MSMWLGVDRAPAGLYIADSVVVKLAPEIFGSKSATPALLNPSLWLLMPSRRLAWTYGPLLLLPRLVNWRSSSEICRKHIVAPTYGIVLA